MIGYCADAQDKLEYDLHLSLRIAKVGTSRYAYIGKSRLPTFPEGDMFPWSYENFAERYGRIVIEQEAKPIVLADESQISELTRLLSIVKMPEDWAEKVFKKAGVEAWTEMDADKAAKVIDNLRSRLSA
jgi:hypothetical protein